MRAVNAAAQGLRETRGGLAERFMVWIEARNRSSNAVEGLGLWTGEDTEEIAALDLWTNTTATRDYQGAGGLLAVSGLQHTAGLEVRPVHVTLSALDATVIAAVREYDARGARVQIWRRTLSAETGLPVGAPEPAFKGFVESRADPAPGRRRPRRDRARMRVGGAAADHPQWPQEVRRGAAAARSRRRLPAVQGDPEAGDAVLGHQRQARRRLMLDPLSRLARPGSPRMSPPADAAPSPMAASTARSSPPARSRRRPASTCAGSLPVATRRRSARHASCAGTALPTRRRLPAAFLPAIPVAAARHGDVAAIRTGAGVALAVVGGPHLLAARAGSGLIALPLTAAFAAFWV